jgi:hypothetical protein
MARIIQFPKRPGTQARLNARPAPDEQPEAWWKASGKMLFNLLFVVLIGFVICTWPLMRWVIVIDLVIQLFRLFFIGGMAGVVAVLHFLVVGIVIYVVIRLARSVPR